MMTLKKNEMDLSKAIQEKFESENFVTKTKKDGVKLLIRSKDLVWFLGYNDNGEKIIYAQSHFCSGIGTGFNSKGITCNEELSQDNYFCLVFTMKDITDFSIFVMVMDDVIKNSLDKESEEKGITASLDRFSLWQNIMQKSRPSIEKVKGLLGELMVLKALLASDKDQLEIVSGWGGPNAEITDFIYSDRWIEVKTTNSHSSVVTINSINQLADKTKDGELIVVYADEDSMKPDLVSVNSLYNEICDLLKDNFKALQQFKNILIESKLILYVQDEDQVQFNISNWDVFNVDSDFPRIVPFPRSSAIKALHYDLIIAALADWRCDNNGWKF